MENMNNKTLNFLDCLNILDSLDDDHTDDDIRIALNEYLEEKEFEESDEN